MLLHLERTLKLLPGTIYSCQQKKHIIPSIKQEAAGYAQRIHPKLIEKIHEFVSEGITDTQEVKKVLKHYTLHVLCPEQKPELTNRACYPTTTDVINHIYKAQRACQLLGSMVVLPI